MNTKRLRRAGVIFEAVPDSGKVGVTVGANGRPEYLWPNRLVLPANLLAELKRRNRTFLYPPNSPAEYRDVSWIVNLCADADEYKSALIGLDEAFGGRLPVFNDPIAVAKSRRDFASSLLDDIPNLIVPKCRRFVARDSKSFQKEFEEHSFVYPVLVRPAASQTGEGLVKVDSPFDWPKVYQSHWFNVPHYMTQFLDYSQNGKYVKIRLVVIGGEVFLRSYRSSSAWLIKGMGGGNDEDINRLMHEHKNFGNWHAAHDVALRIAENIGLDFFGIDLGVAKDGFYFFEANAAMTITVPSVVSSQQASMMEPMYKAINEALRRNLHNPESWHCRSKSEHVSCRDLLAVA